MKIFWRGRLLAFVGGMLMCGNAVASDDVLRNSEIEQRLAALESRLAYQDGVQTASYLAGSNANVAYASEGESQVCIEPCCVDTGGMYAMFEFLWIRPHVNEDWVGKLSESHHLSTRTTLGYENCCGLGVRARYWHFDHTIDVLDPAEIGVNVEVVDLEITNRIGFRTTDVMLGGGFRYAHWTLTDDDGVPVDLDAYGLTMAADGRTPLCHYCANQWSFIYGARWSILGGDWRGDSNIIDTVVTPEVRDDNLLVNELYAGIEHMYRWNGYTLFSRGTAEMQNWRSDVLGEPEIGNGIGPNSIGSTNSISFIGVGLGIGLLY